MSLELGGLHGDIAATINLVEGTPELVDYDEFGVPIAGRPTSDTAGWGSSSAPATRRRR